MRRDIDLKVNGGIGIMVGDIQSEKSISKNISA